ncbi:Endonuclease/exonuclease/phosphatase [Biscogniauxia mediterranea]|nr:Endonuclease/exonuclease/phosphatase [Biscogniauxia mediterranea]
MDELPTELNVVTLNCWGLLYLSKHRAERLTAIGRYLAAAEPTPHIVALQECWIQDDYRSIRRETRFALPFGKFYHSGVFGTGLAILSKWPIEESTMFRYPLNGRPTAFFRGDWYVGKGVACARIRYGSGEKDIVEVFNTHTHPAYEHPQRDTYMVHRLSQAWELSKLIRGATERGHLALALGDFNDVPLSLPYRLMTAHAPVRDAWRVLNPDSSLGSADHEMERARRRPIPTASFNIDENGATCDSAYNTWSWSKSEQKAICAGNRFIPPDTPDPLGQRVDYIFYSRGLSPSVTSELCEILSAHNHCLDDELGGGNLNPPGWVVKDVRVGLTVRHPTLGCSLSDHFSVEATFVLHTPTTQPPTSPGMRGGLRVPTAKEAGRSGGSIHSRPSTEAGALTIGALEQGTYLQSPTASEHRRQNSRDRVAYDAQLQGFHSDAVGAGLPCATYDEILALIRAYEGRERSQRKWRSAHCLAWTLVVLICYVAVWFVPGPVSFVFLILSSLGFLAGAVDGLLALLFFGPELAALNEFEWEIMNAKATASGAYGLVQGGDEGEKTWYGDLP